MNRRELKLDLVAPVSSSNDNSDSDSDSCSSDDCSNVQFRKRKGRSQKKHKRTELTAAEFRERNKGLMVRPKQRRDYSPTKYMNH